MRPRIGITGHAAADYGFPHAKLRRSGSTLEIVLPSVTLRATLQGEFEGGKATAIMPDDLWGHAADIRYGGGGVQSVCAAKLVAPEIPMLYLDSCAPTGLLQRQLGYPGLQVKFLGVRDVPRNAILGDGRQRLILKSPLDGGGRFETEERDKLAWLTQATSVLANSLKDEPVMKHLVEAAKDNTIRLEVVVTKSLDAEFAHEIVLPAAQVVFASADEIGFLVGRTVTCDPSEAIEALAWLRWHAPKATLFLTLGPEGVLVAGPGLDKPQHIRLAEGPWHEVQVHVSQDSTKLCGAGDAFAAGVTVYLQTGKSLLAGGPPWYAPEVNAALAGCALAVRWIGWEPQLHQGDFVIGGLCWPTRVAAAA